MSSKKSKTCVTCKCIYIGVKQNFGHDNNTSCIKCRNTKVKADGKQEVVEILNNHHDMEPTNNEEKKKFRIKNKKLLFTYKSHINKDELHIFISNIAEKKKINVLEIHSAHECGKNDPIYPYEHTHTMVHFDNIFDSIDSRIFDYNDIHPNIKPCGSIKHWVEWYRYLAKEDPENKDLLEMHKENYKPSAEDIWNCSSKQEALRNYGKDIKLVPAILAAWEARPKPKDERTYDLTLKPWQIVILGIMKTPPPGRIIHWIRGVHGGEGKTVFAKMLHSQKKAILINYLSESKNVTERLRGLMEQDNSYHKTNTMILDVARASTIEKPFYVFLEKLFDNELTAEKYKSEDVKVNSGLDMHSFVFSNAYPINGIRHLSADRWRVYDIVDDNLISKHYRAWDDTDSIKPTDDDINETSYESNTDFNDIPKSCSEMTIDCKDYIEDL